MCCFLEARLKIARAGNHGRPPVVFASSPLHVERRVVWSSISSRQLAIAVSTTFEVAQFAQLFFHRNRPNLSSRIGHFCCTAGFPVTSLPSMWRGLAPMHASEKPSQQQARLGLLAPLGQLSLQRGAETRIVSRTGDTNSQHDEPAKKTACRCLSVWLHCRLRIHPMAWLIDPALPARSTKMHWLDLFHPPLTVVIQCRVQARPTTPERRRHQTRS